jgi:hypothetical protein
MINLEDPTAPVIEHQAGFWYFDGKQLGRIKSCDQDVLMIYPCDNQWEGFPGIPTNPSDLTRKE